MRVLHFIEYFSQPTQTFINRYVQKSLQFADVAIASFGFYNVADDIQEIATLYNITDHIYTRKNITGIKRYLVENITGKKLWYAQLDKIIAEFKPDVIHCHFGNMGIILMEFNNIFKGKTHYVTSFYGYDISSQPYIDKKYKKKLNELFIQGNGFFGEGPELLKKAMNLGCPQTKCILNPLLIPIADYPIKTTYRNIDDPIKFLIVGRFIEKKGTDLFLEALGRLQKELNKFSVDIIGSGPLHENYKQIIAEYRLEPFIKWHGMISHDEIINMMRNYDFIVHPSLTAKDNDSEGGAPTIIIEAQAIGLPVITSNHADIPYVMGYHDFLAEENDVNSLMMVIKKIVTCTNIEYYAKQGIDKVSEMHDLKLNTLYEANLKKLIAQ